MDRVVLDEKFTALKKKERHKGLQNIEQCNPLEQLPKSEHSRQILHLL